jgi:hypothetical protein
MSPADKKYYGFIQETIDRISRMKELKQDSPAVTKVVHRFSLPVDLHLKKGEQILMHDDLES